jgi:hypothetical protein
MIFGILQGLLWVFQLQCFMPYPLSYENWEQSIITEVYGLHGFFVAMFILLILMLQRSQTTEQKSRVFNLLCLVTGLSLTNHSTSHLFIPALFFYFLIVDAKFLTRFKYMASGILYGIAGLLPLLYLPIASAADPVLDWGNPETLTGFIRTISRHQYAELEQTSEKFADGLAFYFSNLIVVQWLPVILVLLLPAFYILIKKNRSFSYFSVIFLILYIPVTTYLTDFEVTGNDFKAELYRLLVSVFYIPSYSELLTPINKKR